jgi:hypothetical protein
VVLPTWSRSPIRDARATGLGRQGRRSPRIRKVDPVTKEMVFFGPPKPPSGYSHRHLGHASWFIPPRRCRAPRPARHTHAITENYLQPSRHVDDVDEKLPPRGAIQVASSATSPRASALSRASARATPFAGSRRRRYAGSHRQRLGTGRRDRPSARSSTSRATSTEERSAPSIDSSARAALPPVDVQPGRRAPKE